MQQRVPNTTMASDNEGNKVSTPSSMRGRHNSKLKFLVRSHAMREETSPPREPSPPSIQVIATTEIISSSTTTTPPPLPSSPIVVLSPSRNSPVCISPTSTLVPSSPDLSRSSSQQQQQQQNPCCSSPIFNLNDDDDDDDYDDGDNADNIEDTTVDDTDPKYLSRIINNNNNKHMENESLNSNSNNNNNNNSNKKDNTSHINNNINKKKINCDCSNESCIKCMRNMNNNSTNINNNNNVGSSNTLTVSRISNKRMKQQSNSQQSSFEGSSSNSPCLSRDSSCEQQQQQQYTDTSGTNLEQFIPETLNRNTKDRAFMLRIEQELVSLAKDKIKTHFKFPPMSSYQRMLVHRCAAYFGMEHNIESSGKCVVVNKTKNTRVPDKEFKEHIQDDIVFNDEPPRRSILKRDSNSIEDYTFKSPDRQFNCNSLENRRSKSFEEREEEYEKVRRRIFNRELLRQMHDGTHSNDDFEWAEIAWSNSNDNDPSRFRLQLPEQHRRHAGKLIKVLSEETGETLRPYVAKSYSFGGYGTGLNRNDSVVSTHSAGPRLLTKQDIFLDSGASSVSWRLSPSSSGYKSQSQMSESVTPSPTSTPHLIGESSRQDSAISEDNNNKSGQESIVWAVTDIQSVPKGSIIINPQNGEPIKNDDGSLYHYDPNNPPPGIITTALKPPPSPKKKPNSPQRTNSNNNGNNERSQSPNNSNNNNNNNSKKRSLKYSPNCKSHVTNSSTSPSLPYSPPTPVAHQQQQQLQQQHQRNFQYVENVPPQYPIYSPTIQSGSIPDNCGGAAVTVYQQPCIVYTTPYGVPVSPHFDGRMEPSIPPDMGTTYYMSIPENTTTYQQPSTYWNQQPINYYQNPQTNPARFSVPIHPQGQTGYVSTFPQNYLPQTNQPPPQPQSTDLGPVYPSQQMQVVYSAQPPAPQPPPSVVVPPTLQQQQQPQLQQQNPSNAIIYPNQPNIIYTQSPIYPTAIYPPQQYPQNTPTPNSCTSSFIAGQISEQQQQQQTNVMQVTQNLAQMNLISHQQISNNIGTNNPNFNKIVPSPYDVRQKVNISKNNGKFNNSTTKFVMNSSQSSSTGTNSPATTVLAGYCPQQNIYRTPPDTPPTQFGYGANYQIPPMLFRQMSNVRANTPGTNRSSRSPTPASDIQHFDKQRIPLAAPPPPPTIYHGMPYVIQSYDNRIIPGRGQPNAYRQPTFTRQQQQQQQQQQQHFESRNYRNRKSK